MKTTRILYILFPVLSVLSACGGGADRHPLASGPLKTLSDVQQSPSSTGEQIYEGRVYSLAGRPDPLFRYERRVHAENAALVSTHLTYAPSGTVVVIQSAAHTPTYDLVRADLIHGQTGVSGSMTRLGNRLTFTLNKSGRVSTTSENVSDPVVAGPTMFGYILAHWDDLTGGAALPIRFAVIERGETLGFTLDKVDSASGVTTIRMKPSSLVVRLAVAPTYFQFETNTRKILEYTGRVPPFETVNNRLETLDARVAYRFVAATFQ